MSLSSVSLLKAVQVGAVAAAIAVSAATADPAFAFDVTKGKAIFQSNCMACHRGGKNTINPRKTLRLSDLEKYDMFSQEAVQAQVTKGKAAMPRFGGRLKPSQIEDVAAFVIESASIGWK